jgi:putative tricarboxylic transport membrane protein
MDTGIWQQVMYGFSVCLQPGNLLFAFIGVVVGNLVGVLPGLGPVAAMSLLLPATFYLSPTASVIMLAGIYYGAMYGGTITSVLVNIPGEAASVVTCLDGYAMANKGRAGPALSMAAIGSFIGGAFSILGLVFISRPAAEFGLKFGPPEFFSLMMFSMVMVSYLASGSKVKALIMCVLGLFVATIGMDAISGRQRFTFGSLFLQDGLDLIPIIMGLFGVSEVLVNIEENTKRKIFSTGLKNILPNREESRRSVMPIARGSVLGALLGLIPGGGALISSFLAYTLEKKISREPEKFGTGMSSFGNSKKLPGY